MSNSIERRDFLKSMGIASVTIAGAGALAACSSPQTAGSSSGGSDSSGDASSGAGEGTAAAATTAAADVAWDEECDVLVVGCGFAGLAAAIEATEAGSSVILIDKMPVIGGNSAINGGDMAAVGTPLQVEAGVEDSTDLMYDDMLRTGKYYNHTEKVRTLVENSADAVAWCEKVGVTFSKLNFHGGHSVPRTNTTENATGADITNAEADYLAGLGVEPRLNTYFDKLIEDESGRIVGATIRTGYTMGKDDSGDPVNVKANKGVVLAAGGFAQNVQMRMIHEPRLTDELDSTNHAGATGETLREAMKHKAMDVHMDWIQLGPWTSPDEIGFGYTPQFCERLVGYGIMVDPDTGERFIKETGDRKERADKMLELGHVTYIIADAPTCERQVVPRIMEGGQDVGVILEFDTLEDFCQEVGMTSEAQEAFMAQVERWNGYIADGEDPEFGALIQEGATPMETAPFYAAKLWPKVHHCMGGLVTNSNAQVIDQDFNPIPGLYAAGEITGGTHGAVRLGSCAITDCVVFGRIAGQQVAAQ